MFNKLSTRDLFSRLPLFSLHIFYRISSILWAEHEKTGECIQIIYTRWQSSVVQSTAFSPLQMRKIQKNAAIANGNKCTASMRPHWMHNAFRFGVEFHFVVNCTRTLAKFGKRIVIVAKAKPKRLGKASNFSKQTPLWNWILNLTESLVRSVADAREVYWYSYRKCLHALINVRMQFNFVRFCRLRWRTEEWETTCGVRKTGKCQKKREMSMTDQCAMHRWMIVKYVVVYALRMQMCVGLARFERTNGLFNTKICRRTTEKCITKIAQSHRCTHRQSTHWPLFDRSIDSVFWLFRLFATHSQSTTGWRLVVVVVFVSRLHRCLHIYRTIRCRMDSRTHRNPIDFIFHFSPSHSSAIALSIKCKRRINFGHIFKCSVAVQRVRWKFESRIENNCLACAIFTLCRAATRNESQSLGLVPAAETNVIINEGNVEHSREIGHGFHFACSRPRIANKWSKNYYFSYRFQFVGSIECRQRAARNSRSLNLICELNVAYSPISGKSCTKHANFAIGTHSRLLLIIFILIFSRVDFLYCPVDLVFIHSFVCFSIKRTIGSEIKISH